MDYELHDDLTKILYKLSSKDPALYNAIRNKVKEIKNGEYLDHYKNLRKPLQEYKRVHITEQFVLIFRADKQNDKLIFRYFEHRNKIYNIKLD